MKKNLEVNDRNKEGSFEEINKTELLKDGV
jgi:hypothetical protein